VELAVRREVDTELEALQTLAAQVRDLMLDKVDGPSSLAASLSTVAKLLKGGFDTVAASRVHRGTRSALVAPLLHFPEPEKELWLVRSGHNRDPTKDRTHWRTDGMGE
jgi:hypothetical protein